MLPRYKDTSIGILGDGGWGTTLAIHLAKKGFAVTLWGAFRDYLSEVETARENRKFLPGFHIPEKVKFDSDLGSVVSKHSTLFIAVPSKYFAQVAARIPRKEARTRRWVSVSKGIDEKSLKLMSAVAASLWGNVNYAAVSGPTIAREVAAGSPTAVVCASREASFRRDLRGILDTEHFTVYESADVIGVELGGAVKNVIAIAAGIVDGLGLGSNTKSVLLARGIAEIARLGEKMGARRHTFMGLSGLGDLATTCFSIHSRNHACGVEIGKGDTVHHVVKSTEMVIEGVTAAVCAHKLSRRYKVSMPIVNAVYRILFERENPKKAIEALMHKSLVDETD